MTISTQKDELEIPQICPKCEGKRSIIARTEQQHDCYKCGYVVSWDVEFISTLQSPQGPQYYVGVMDFPSKTLGGQKKRNIETATFKKFMEENPLASRHDITFKVGVTTQRIRELSRITGIEVKDLPKEELTVSPPGRTKEREIRRTIVKNSFLEHPDWSIGQHAKHLGLDWGNVAYWAKALGHIPPEESRGKLTGAEGEELKQYCIEEFTSDPNITIGELCENSGYTFLQVKSALQRAKIKIKRRVPRVSKMRFLELYTEDPNKLMREYADLLNITPHGLAAWAKDRGYVIVDDHKYTWRSPSYRRLKLGTQSDKWQYSPGRMKRDDSLFEIFK